MIVGLQRYRYTLDTLVKKPLWRRHEGTQVKSKEWPVCAVRNVHSTKACLHVAHWRNPCSPGTIYHNMDCHLESWYQINEALTTTTSKCPPYINIQFAFSMNGQHRLTALNLSAVVPILNSLVCGILRDRIMLNVHAPVFCSPGSFGFFSRTSVHSCRGKLTSICSRLHGPCSRSACSSRYRVRSRYTPAHWKLTERLANLRVQ